LFVLILLWLIHYDCIKFGFHFWLIDFYDFELVEIRFLFIWFKMMCILAKCNKKWIIRNNSIKKINKELINKIRIWTWTSQLHIFMISATKLWCNHLDNIKICYYMPWYMQTQDYEFYFNNFTCILIIFPTWISSMLSYLNNNKIQQEITTILTCSYNNKNQVGKCKNFFFMLIAMTKLNEHHNKNP
jgi:hypothetical protein